MSFHPDGDPRARGLETDLPPDWGDYEPLSLPELVKLRELVIRYEVNHVHRNVTAEAFSTIRRAVRSSVVNRSTRKAKATE